MNIALIGYGKMGKAIEAIARKRGHRIVSVIDIENKDEFGSEAFRSAEVAIEFTGPQTAVDNYRQCFAANVAVVSGTTGWLEREEEVKQLCLEGGHTFFYASNFSIGVNIFFALNEYLAKVMDQFSAYEVRMEETHHIHKLDAPSGTAITLAEGIIRQLGRIDRWTPDEDLLEPAEGVMPIRAKREGEVSGIHEVIYESEADYIRIRHEAKSRAGFALGAVLAAEFTAGRKGLLSMKDMLTF